MGIANERLNYQAIALEEAETKIRKAVKQQFFAERPRAETDKTVFKIIAEALKLISIAELKVLSQKSLLRFYREQYDELTKSFGPKLKLMRAVYMLDGHDLNGNKVNLTQKEKLEAINTVKLSSYGDKFKAVVGDGSRIMGNAMNRFAQDYIRKEVKPALDRLAKTEPRDPDATDLKHRTSLRNLAEMQVRYQGHLDDLASFRAQEIKLVIISAHADCSERCASYQGKVFSLDGSRGVTDDGRSYVPIETAIDRVVYTKTGKAYINGLFGFNCRHYMIPYEPGLRVPEPNVTEDRREYAITMRQRALEREVRYWRTQAVEHQGQNTIMYRVAKKQAIQANEKYIRYSREHHRAYYPSRVAII